MNLSETEIPANGGWIFRDPAYNFVIDRPESVSITLTQAVEKIISCRLKNAAITAQHNKSTDFYAVKQELMNYTRARLGIPLDASPPKWNPAQPWAAAVAGAAANAAAGVKTIAAWLGDGMKPVVPELSEKRAGICVVCPKNQGGNMLQRMEGWAARQFKILMDKKNELKATTSFDSQLKTCVACDCLAELKVHVPLDHILRNTSDTVMANLDKSCWIKNRDK